MTEPDKNVDLSKLSQEELEAYSIAFDRVYCKKHFYFFVRRAAPIILGGQFIDGPHIAAIAYHLQALWEGTIQTLDGDQADMIVINTPPGVSKSSLACVLYSSWLWIQDPSAGQWFSSFGQKLCNRDSMRTRSILTSEWFQKRWGSEVSLTDSQNQKELFWNAQGGWRLAAAVRSGAGFGDHPSIFVWDDPLDPNQAASETERTFVMDYWTEKISTRGMVRGVKRVLIAQRLHEDDPSGNILYNEEGVAHLMLPMEFELKRKCKTKIQYHDIDDSDEEGNPKLKNGWEDWRTEEGQLMWPEGMDERKVSVLKSKLRRAHAIAGQLQQRPSSPEGDMFLESWIKYVDEPPEDGIAIRSWDKASSTGTRSDYTAGVLVVYDGEFYYITDVVRGKWERGERDDIILAVSESDSDRWSDYTILFEQETGASGKDAAEIAAGQVRDMGYRVRITRSTSKKEVRWDTLADAMANRKVKLVKGRWNKAFVDELLGCPNGRNDDQVDAASAAFSKAAKSRRFASITRPLLLLTKDEQKKLDKAKSGGDKKQSVNDYLKLIDSRSKGSLGVRW